MQVEQQEQVDKADEEQYLEEEEVGLAFNCYPHQFGCKRVVMCVHFRVINRMERTLFKFACRILSRQ